MRHKIPRPLRNPQNIETYNAMKTLPQTRSLASYRRSSPSGSRPVLQPNFAYCAKQYFDFFDHRLIFTHKGMAEGLAISGFQLEQITARFLPYTSKSGLPTAPWMVSMYLALPPVCAGWAARCCWLA